MIFSPPFQQRVKCQSPVVCNILMLPTYSVSFRHTTTVFFFFMLYAQKIFLNLNKKVLLRERKRHTASRVPSARYADLSPDREGGTPSSPLTRQVPHLVLDWGGTPCWDLGWGTPTYGPGIGYPHPDLGQGTPIQTWDGVPSLPSAGRGTPPSVEV